MNRDELTRHHNQLIHNLKASIISAWNEAVYEHYEANPFTEAEIAVLSDRAKRKYLQEKRIESAYGTTLIAVACTKDYWFGIHIGDGKCVAINPEGKFVILLCALMIASVPFGAKRTVAARKARIEKRAKSLGYDLTFDK